MTRLFAKPQAAVLLALCLLGLCGEARALDPELTTPYKVKVVLRVAPNRLLTPIFKQQLQRDLLQGLQAALGAMGDVEVIDLGEVPADKQEPLWQKVAAEGLQAGLDKPGLGTSDVKTHFVNVDYVDGQYEIQARQYDGLTGTATPAVRHERTPDRQFVARTAALLVDRDFGLVGTVTGGGDGQSVRVAFKGGGLKVPLDRWLKKGDVLALVQVRGDGQTRREPWMLLQADAAPGEDGSCPCKLFSAQKRLPTAAGAGFRCIKLGTIKAPVRLRVVEYVPNGPPRPLDSPPAIYIGRLGFVDWNDSNKVGHVPDADGFYSTEQEKDKPLYDGVAFVTVEHNGGVRAMVPLALVDDHTVTLPIKLGTEPPALVQKRRFWVQDLLDEQTKLDGLFKSLSEDIGKAGRAPTLDRARKALDDLDKRITRFDEERKELADVKPVKGEKPLDLSTGNAVLQDIKKRRGELAKWVTDLDRSVKDQKPGEEQEVLAAVEQARYHEKQGDYGQAIELYEKVLAKTKDAKLEQRLAKLKEAWKPQGDEHAKARDFIYQTWPKLDARTLTKDRAKEAQAALAACRKVKDPFGPRKLLVVAQRHFQQVIQELEDLKATLDTVEADRKRANELEAVGDSLKTLIEDAKKAIEEAPVP